jgi:plastocyanin
MRSLPRPVLCLLPAAVVLALSLCWPVLAGPPGAVEITITKPDGTERYPLLPEGKSDLVGEYEIRQPNGSIAKVDATGGVSLYSLLRVVGAQTGYETIVVRRSNGRTLTLTRDEIEADLRPPGFFTNDATGKTMFIGYGMREVEARHYFEISLAGQVRIEQIAEARSVDLKASRTEIDPGQSVTFTATTRPKGAYRYDWTLEPGVLKKDAGSKVTHRFDEEGRFEVVVRVYTSDDDRDSERGTVTIQVGDPKQSDKDREGGGDNPAPGAPSSGPSTGSIGTGSYDDSSTSAPSTPTPPPTTPDPPPTPDAGLTTGTPVTGNLLADASDPPPSDILESAAKAARDGNLSDDSNAGVDVPDAALSIAGVLALLALGAGIENRQGRRRPLPRRFRFRPASS